MDTFIAKRKKVMIIKKLVEGYEAVNQLKLLLIQKPFVKSSEEEEEKDELVANVQRSFSESLFVLTSSSEQGCGRNLLCFGENESPAVEYSGDEECGKRSSPPIKNRGRGCYKRRRNAQSWTKVSPSVDDDHSWRKYGQKVILNSKFPRSYFRCSRKYEQGCHATKQVQRTQDNPEMYQTTYIGFHTCQSSSTTTLVVGNYSHPDSNNNKVLLINQQDHPMIVKQEEISKEDTTTPSGGDDDDDIAIWSDLKDFDHNRGTSSLYYSSVHFGTHDHDFHFDDDM